MVNSANKAPGRVFSSVQFGGSLQRLQTGRWTNLREVRPSAGHLCCKLRSPAFVENRLLSNSLVIIQYGRRNSVCVRCWIILLGGNDSPIVGETPALSRIDFGWSHRYSASKLGTFIFDARLCIIDNRCPKQSQARHLRRSLLLSSWSATVYQSNTSTRGPI